jgi:transposase
MQCASLDQLLDPEHPARLVWEATGDMDLTSLWAPIRAVEGHVGRDATDPRILLAVWIYATLQGVASARALAKLCEEHIAYRWLCGGVTLNYHLLSDFRSRQETALDELLTQRVAALLASGLVTMHCVAQDGMKVRASAGRSSFRRRVSLERCLEEARQQVDALKQLADEDPQELKRRQRQAKTQAAERRVARVQEALAQLQTLEEQQAIRLKKQNKKRREEAPPPRGSTTDPDARTMKFADGGFRPAYNTQFSTDTASGIIVGVEVTNQGSDQGQLLPMLDQLQKRYRRSPREALVDGGYVKLEDIDAAATKHECLVYAPLPGEEKKLKAGLDPYQAEKRDTPATRAWRERMKTSASRQLYKLRAQTAEWVNALCRNRGLRSFPVRTRRRCHSVALLYAIAHNVQQTYQLLHRAAT